MRSALLCCCCCLLAAVASAQVDPYQVYATLQFKKGKALNKLPGAKDLKPPRLVRSTTVHMSAARLQGPSPPLMIDFVTPVYVNNRTGAANIFGPTLRLRGGDTLSITMLNNLTQPGSGGPASELNSFHAPMVTNLHAHGVHSPPGVADQAVAGTYLGGDNIFYTVAPKGSPSDTPQNLTYTFTLGKDHLPGLFWYHPHAHGSTVIQTPTANGLIIVEDDPRWLPDDTGCGEVRALLEGSREVVLHLALLPFKAPTRSTRTAGPVGRKLLQGGGGGSGGGGGGRGNQPFNQQWAIDRDDSNLQIYSQLTAPKNPLMLAPHTVSGTASNQDFVLLNGGYQPTISMKGGVFQRWRVAWATIKRFAILTIADPATGQPSPDCELLLLSKDGVYLQKLPRKVDHIFLSPGNRAELLARCNGPAGKKYVLRSGATPFNPYGVSCNFNTPNLFEQSIIATINLITASKGTPGPKLEACTPRRPGYAADLRDASLVAAGATAKLVRQPVTFTMGQAFGCLVNGQNFSFPDPNPIDLPLGSVVEWDMNHAAVHPMHAHTNPHMLASLPTLLLPGCSTNPWFQVGDYHDTTMIPFAMQGATIRLRIQPGEYTGYTVMHCHSLQHEDLGCMKVMKFSCPGVSDPQPQVCPGFKFPVPGTFA